jgi:2',3'-cyclic-nucleotide 2'-phosphodiesterase (5'-nucleotidase family)
MAGMLDISRSQSKLNTLDGTLTEGFRPSYSADWGDYISFSTRIREKAEASGQDLLVIDTGDRIEGNGLYDASDPKGRYTFNIFKQQHIDVICTGNHELYKRNSSENEYNITVPNFRDSYLASNLDITDPKTGELVPLAPRFKKFTTKKQGIRIMAFGFIFDFLGNNNNTVIQPVEDTVKETWFRDAIRDREVDLFLVIGHVPVRSPEYDDLFNAIRSVQWDTPIQFFGGHTHIRDYKKYDAKSFALESGRFMETIGFQSIDGLSTGTKHAQISAAPRFSRKYIDNNLFSFYHHTGLNATTFPTEHGQNVSKEIKAARADLHLDNICGCAQQDLWMTRAKYPSNSSIFTWLEERVLPDIVVDEHRANNSRLAMLNTGGIRFDIFKGPFTRDSTYIVSPFTSGFRYVKDVPYDKASKLLSVLNNNRPMFQNMEPSLQNWLLAPVEQRSYPADVITEEMPKTYAAAHQIPLTTNPDLTPGYTTKDDAGSDGDDTLHEPISFYRVPNVIQSRIDPPAQIGDPETVDVVYIEFIEPWLLLAFNILDLDYSIEDTAIYMEGENLTTLLAKWVTANWRGDC